LSDIPLLLLVYNRPDQVRGLVDSLRPLRPRKIMVGIDGPSSKPSDTAKVKAVEEEIGRINWTDDVEIRSRDSNIGIRFAVPDAVSWAIGKHGRAIILEDDVRPGRDFLQFMNFTLKEYQAVENIGHVSGYNPVPTQHLTKQRDMLRLSRFPESYAWGTWERSWSKFSDSLEWAVSLSPNQMSELTGSWIRGKVWEMNFKDAHLGAISSWAYRWVASLWRNDLVCLSPNRNLCQYTGQSHGTHTFSPRTFSELSVSEISELTIPEVLNIDTIADNFISEKVFRSTPIGLLRRYMESTVLNMLPPRQ
jgi:hypothetical protein